MESLLASAPGGRRVSELSRELNLHKTTVVRLLHTLVMVGTVRKQSGTDLYVWEPLRWVGIAENMRKLMSSTDGAQGILDGVARDTGGTALLAFPDVSGRNMRIGAVSLPEREIRVEPTPQRLAPMHCTAAGKAYLMGLSAEEVTVLAEGGTGPVTSDSVSWPDDLDAELKRSRERGYAVSRDEFIPGTAGVGVPVVDDAGDVSGALELITIAEELSGERIKRWGDVLRRASGSLTRLLYPTEAPGAGRRGGQREPGVTPAGGPEEEQRRPYRVV
jgi:DNA-binding IclR family transcriptional regulator